MQMDKDPFFFEPSILNIRTKYDITLEQQQLAFNYKMRNPESCNGGKEENDGMPFEEIAVKDPAVWSM